MSMTRSKDSVGFTPNHQLFAILTGNNRTHVIDLVSEPSLVL